MEIFIEALTNAILITGLVMIMMILIEYINVSSTGDALLKLRASKKRQVVLAAALGLIPGCVGGFAVVSLYARRVVSFGALIAMMIASSGDEAFIILALIPKEALFLFLFLFLIGISSGFIVDAIEERRAKTRGLQEEEPLPIVESECCGNESRESHPIFEGTIWGNLKRMSRKRAFMLLGITLFIVAIVSGLLEHEHLHDSLIEGEHLHDSLEHHHHFNIFNERWINLLFAGLSLVILLSPLKQAITLSPTTFGIM